LAQNLMATLLLVSSVGRTVCSGVAPGTPKESGQEAESAGDPSRQERQPAPGVEKVPAREGAQDHRAIALCWNVRKRRQRSTLTLSLTLRAAPTRYEEIQRETAIINLLHDDFKNWGAV
jgi:hypothetical protein